MNESTKKNKNKNVNSAPISTYRIQFNPSFGFEHVREVISYLSDMNISSIYASPIFKPREGSTHGYDIVDPNQLNPELGTQEEFEILCDELNEFHMGWLQDIVPNHMAYDRQNELLMDIMESGEDSKYYSFFDIQWDHPYESIKGKILAPFMGDFFGESLERGEIRLDYGQNGFFINYFDLSFPLKIDSYATILSHGLRNLKRKIGEHPDYTKFLGILYVLRTHPDGEEEYDKPGFVKRMLWELYTKNEDIKDFIDHNVLLFNGTVGESQSFELLETLLREQLFRLSFWKVASEEINYRRFFSINELICLRVEDEEVFNYTHSLVLDMLKKGKFSGIRVDHIDGLYDPTDYLRRLREKADYVIVEKILEPEEELPSFWPVEGTTGYEFIYYVNNLFCRRENEREFDRIYSSFTGMNKSYSELLLEKKRLIIGKHMAGDVENLALLLKNISSKYRHGSDKTLYGIKRALVEIMAQFPIYRTYTSSTASREKDREFIKEAIRKARRKIPDLQHELNYIQDFLLLELWTSLSEEEKEQFIHFVMRFQQFTGPLMAKGFEDTFLYVYNRFISLNEVGGEPIKFGISIESFHEFNKKRTKNPHTLNATSTHDTKRGEDVRARLNVLSEMPQEWEESMKEWAEINRSKKKVVEGEEVPDKNDEYFLYQTLVGAYPFDNELSEFTQRIKDYVIKAIREAKVHTAWIKPDSDYEEAFVSFVDDILEPGDDNQFLSAFLPFVKKVSYPGIFNSLSQTLIKITAPGVPDFYQGTELWDLNLVDPDNRRPIDFEKRKKLLQQISEREDTLELIQELLSSYRDGRIKLFLIQRALKARKENMEVFQKGDYVPLEVKGKYQDHIIAFARAKGERWAVTVAPRFVSGLAGVNEMGEKYYPLDSIWEDTHIVIPAGLKPLKDSITGIELDGDEKLMVRDALKYFPVALILGERT
ncbi:MAG: malto-oligosyltrehalose synthase [Halobacteriota archaeon]